MKLIQVAPSRWIPPAAVRGVSAVEVSTPAPDTDRGVIITHQIILEEAGGREHVVWEAPTSVGLDAALTDLFLKLEYDPAEATAAVIGAGLAELVKATTDAAAVKVDPTPMPVVTPPVVVDPVTPAVEVIP